MKNEFIPYEQAVALKELGYSGIDYAGWCHAWEKNPNPYFRASIDEAPYDISAPLYQQAFRWFREKYNLFGCIDLHSCIPPHWFVRIDNIMTNDYVFHSEDEHKKFTTYEEAELCLFR